MAAVKSSNSQLEQNFANMRAEKRKLPFSSSSSSSSEDEEDAPPPVAQAIRKPPPPRRSPSTSSLPASENPRYSPSLFSPARSPSPSPSYTPTPIHALSQRTSEERLESTTPSLSPATLLPSPAQLRQQQALAAPSTPQHPAPVPSTLPPPQPQAATTVALTADPDSPVDPATITYYAPPGASFIFDNETEIQITWSGAGYGKFICVNHSQRAFKLAFPKQLELFATFLDLCSTSPQAATDRKQDFEYYKWALPLFSREFKRKVQMSAQKGHPQLSSDGLLPRSEEFQLSLEKARLDKTSPEIFTKATESSELKRTLKALKSDSLKGLPKLTAFTELSFPNDPLLQLLMAPPAVNHDSVCDLPLSSTYYKTPSIESIAPHHLLKRDTLKQLSVHTCLYIAYQSAEFFLEKHGDLLTKEAREELTAHANWLLHTQQGCAREVHANLKELSFWQLRLKNEAMSHQFNTSLKRSLLYKEPLSSKHLLHSEAAAMVESLPRTQLVYADKLQQPLQPSPAAAPSTSGSVKHPAKPQQVAARSHREPFRPQGHSRRQGYDHPRPRGSSHSAASSSKPSHSYRGRGSYGGKSAHKQQQGSIDPTRRQKTQPKKPPSSFRKSSSSH